MSHQTIPVSIPLMDGYDDCGYGLDTPSVTRPAVDNTDHYLSAVHADRRGGRESVHIGQSNYYDHDRDARPERGVPTNYVFGHVPQSTTSDNSNDLYGPWGVERRPPSLTNASSEGIDNTTNAPLHANHYLRLSSNTTEEEKAARRICLCQMNYSYTLHKYLNDNEESYGTTFESNEIPPTDCRQAISGGFLELSVVHGKLSMKVGPPHSSRRSKPSTGEQSSLEGSRMFQSMSGILEETGAWMHGGVLYEKPDYHQLHVSEMLEETMFTSNMM